MKKAWGFFSGAVLEKSTSASGTVSFSLDDASFYFLVPGCPAPALGCFRQRQCLLDTDRLLRER